MIEAASKTELKLQIAGADVTVRGPQTVIGVVDRMLAQVDRMWAGESEPLTVDVSFQSGVWSVFGKAPASRKTLGIGNALPQVAGAVVSSVLAEISWHRDVVIWRAAVVERDGQALVFIGDDWESCITLTAHLHTRGWNILGGDYALISEDTLIVSAFRKVLHANSSCIASFPLWYRRAIEASPWYSTASTIAFYAIDPRLVQEASPWGDRARLSAVINVDGRFDEHPSLQAVEGMSFSGALCAADLSKAGVEVANLVVGDFIETCDLLDRWFASIVVSA
jgi:hypothetical protein